MVEFRFVLVGAHKVGADKNRNLVYNTEYFLTNKILSDIFLLALITNKLLFNQKTAFY